MSQQFKSQIDAEEGIKIDKQLYDAGNSAGTSGQILSSTGTAIDWIDASTLAVGESEQVHIACKNTSGVAISKGDPVYITGTVGTSYIIEVAAADASNSAKMPAVGLAETDLAINAEGYVIVSGVLKNLTTDPLSTGDGTPSSNNTVYVKAGGGLTRTKPTGSGNLIQNVGKVGRVNSSNAGSLAVSTIMRTNDVPNLTTGKIWVGSSTYTTESTVVHLDEGNGRMGIGTPSPGEKLAVAGNIDITGNIHVDSSYGFSNSGAWTRNATPYGYIDFGPANTSHAHIYTDRPTFYFNKQLLVLGSTVWNSGNDGSGSGLDADLLDGQHASAFALASHTHAASDITSGTLADARLSSNVFLDRGAIDVTTVTDGSNSNPFDDAHSETQIAENGSRQVSYTGASAHLFTSFVGGSASVLQLGAHYNGSDFYMRVRTDGSSWKNWRKLWHNGNDGASSGLDADLLDGQHGSYYLDYNNFTNTPTIPSAYTHPTHPGDDINLDTGPLTGATVISDLDFNITTDTLGHVTDANATYSTRNLTASDIGAAASSHTHDDRYYTETEIDNKFSGAAAPSGYNKTNWDTAYNNSIVSAAVSGTTTKTLTLTQQDAGTVTATWTDLTGSGGITGSGTTNYIPKWSSSSALTDSPIVDSSGNIGINISSPAKRLHIGTSSNSGSTTEEFRIQTGRSAGFGGNAVINMDTGNYGTSGIYMGDSGALNYSSQPGKIEWLDVTPLMQFTSSNAYAWNVSTSTKMYMTSAGDVGIGTTTPAEKLEVVGNIEANKYINQRVAWNSTFTHTSGTGVWNYIPVGYIIEQTTDTYYLNWIAAYGGRVRKVVLRGAGTGNTQTATTTQFRVDVNGSTVYTTGTLTVTGTSPDKVVSFEFSDTQATFSATDRVQVLFNSNGLWYNAAVGIIIEYTE